LGLILQKKKSLGQVKVMTFFHKWASLLRLSNISSPNYKHNNNALRKYEHFTIRKQLKYFEIMKLQNAIFTTTTTTFTLVVCVCVCYMSVCPLICKIWWKGSSGRKPIYLKMCVWERENSVCECERERERVRVCVLCVCMCVYVQNGCRGWNRE